MRILLAITAVLEAGTGLALLIAPSALAVLLLGAPLDSSPGVVIGRVFGSALLAIGVGCGFARVTLAVEPPRASSRPYCCTTSRS